MWINLPINPSVQPLMAINSSAFPAKQLIRKIFLFARYIECGSIFLNEIHIN